MALRVLKEKDGDGVRYRFIGPLNDSANAVYYPILNESSPWVTFDFSGITTINSSGISDWLKFIPGLCAKTLVRFENCPDVVVFNFNIIPMMRGNGQIKSLIRSSTCKACGKSGTSKIIVDANLNRSQAPGPCIHCKSLKSEWDYGADYFQILGATSGPPRQ